MDVASGNRPDAGQSPSNQSTQSVRLTPVRFVIRFGSSCLTPVRFVTLPRFGSSPSTSLTGGATARNGFEALAALDSNADGILDARDPAFAELVL